MFHSSASSTISVNNYASGASGHRFKSCRAHSCNTVILYRKALPFGGAFYFPYLVKYCHIYSNEGQILRDTYNKKLFVDLIMEWRWDKNTKIALIALIIGVIVGAIMTVLAKYFKGTL